MGDPIVSLSFEKENLLRWRIAHGLKTRFVDNELIVDDGTEDNWHLLRLDGAEFLYRLVRMKLLIRRLGTSSVNFYVHHFGSVDVAEIGLDGIIVDRGITNTLSVDRVSEDLLEIELEFLNRHPTLSIGCSNNRQPVFPGTGREQFAILSIRVEARDASLELSKIPDDERIKIVDVGGAGGLQLKWMLRADRIIPILFEPSASEAQTLRRTIERIPGGRVIEAALAHRSGMHDLHVAASAGCSSLREPDFRVLDEYSISPFFKILKEEQVSCVRYDELFAKRLVPAPDVIKIDVQGFEYEALLGFGSLLEHCIGIELETHFYPLYKGQKLVGDIVAYLEGFDFVLRSIAQVPNFDGDSVEVDALFTKRRRVVLNLPENQKGKFKLLTDVWRIPSYF
jgi:FkbM family methyltransferase